jgi:hypothetical protein
LSRVGGLRDVNARAGTCGVGRERVGRRRAVRTKHANHGREAVHVGRGGRRAAVRWKAIKGGQDGKEMRRDGGGPRVGIRIGSEGGACPGECRLESSLGVELAPSAGMPASRRNRMRWALGGRAILAVARSLAKEAGGATVVINRR